MLVLRRPRKELEALVPLNQEARNALISIRYTDQVGKDQFVFTGRSGPMTRRGVDMLVNRYSRMAGIKGVTPGTLRHTFCMNLVIGGVSPYVIAQLIGNGSMEMVRRYYIPGHGDDAPKNSLEEVRPTESRKLISNASPSQHDVPTKWSRE